MKAKYTFLSLAEDVLSKTNMPLTVQEIWEQGVAMGLDKKINSEGLTPIATLSARLYKNVNKCDDKKRFFIVSKKPTLFWLLSRKSELPTKESINNFLEDSYIKAEESNTYHERMLHQVLTNFVNNCSLGNIFVKTIFHEKSRKSNKGQDKWNYPDMVGVSFIFFDEEYNKSTIELMRTVQYPVCNLYSFEIKKSLTFGNYKESFFQAVSNSSWANDGYLVAVDINEEVKIELKRLCDAFGIGLIQLDINNVDNSKIIYSSKHKNVLDMATIELLVSKNEIFSEFINNINNSIRLNQVVDQVKYDKVLSEDELKKYIEKFIK